MEHDFAAPPIDVINIQLDPGFHRGLELPDLDRPDVVEESSDGAMRVLRLRYEFVGHLDPVAKKLLGSRSLTWLQDLRVDTATSRGSLHFAAEADPNRLNGDASITYDERPDHTTVRTIEGDLHVRVPLIGGTAEKRIVPGLVRRLNVEAAALARALEGRA